MAKHAKGKPATKVVYRTPPRYPLPRLRGFFARMSPMYQLSMKRHRAHQGEGSRAWIYAYYLAAHLKNSRRRAKGGELAARVRLEPGGTYQLVALRPTTRKERKAAKRAR